MTSKQKFDLMKQAAGIMDEHGNLLTPPIYVINHLLIEGRNGRVMITPNGTVPLTFIPSLAGDVHFVWMGSHEYHISKPSWNGNMNRPLYGAVVRFINYQITFNGYAGPNIEFEHDFDPDDKFGIDVMMTARGMINTPMELHKSLHGMPKLGSDLEYFQFSDL